MKEKIEKINETINGIELDASDILILIFIIAILLAFLLSMDRK